MNEPAPDALRMPEDVAHRLLARAVELDAARATQIPMGQLREIAREAGISAAALEAALDEMRAQPPALVPRTVPRLRWESVAANVLAFVAFWGVLMLLVRLCRVADVGWQVRKTVDVVALLTGAGIAGRLRARPALFVLAGFALAQGAEVAMDLIYGVPAVRGAGAHFALIIAGIGGVALGTLLARRRGVPPTRAIDDVASIADAARETADASHQRASTGMSLRLGLTMR